MLSWSSTRCAEWAPLWSRNSVRSSVRPSVWPPVCMSHACFVTKLNNALGIFWYHTKAQSLWFSDTNSGRWAMPLPSEICAQSDQPPSKNADYGNKYGPTSAVIRLLYWSMRRDLPEVRSRSFQSGRRMRNRATDTQAASYRYSPQCRLRTAVLLTQPAHRTLSSSNGSWQYRPIA